MPKAPINGIELYYESHGSGPAIVFAHGRGGNHMSWWQQVARFSGEYRCITFDHRGWGQSIAEYGSPLRENFGTDLIALLDYLGIEEAFLVAQSMGGISCTEFALAHPERTLGLVLGDTTGGVVSPGVLAELAKTNPPEGVARSLAPGFIAEQPSLTFLYQQIQGLNPERGEDGVISGFRREDGRQEADFFGLADTDAADSGRPGRYLPAQRHSRGAEGHSGVADGGGVRGCSLHPLREGRRVQRPAVRVLRRSAGGADSGSDCGLVLRESLSDRLHGSKPYGAG